jgi:cyclophilin family peptidyl-prolyl cis-trans isomerase
MSYFYRCISALLALAASLSLYAAEPVQAPISSVLAPIRSALAPLNPGQAPVNPAQLSRSLTYDGKVIDIPIDHPNNPLVVLRTSHGDLIIELFPTEAPKTVANFLELALGQKSFNDPATNERVKKPYFDGLVFHRVVKDFMIQTGSPTGLGDGYPGFRFDDEISALSLGLDKMFVVDSQGNPSPVLGIRSQTDFQQRVLAPLYKAMTITDAEQLELRLNEVDQRLRAMTVMEYYEMLGYRFQNPLQSHAPVRGVVAMANSGPNSNGSQFFITVADTPWLTGKHTVFGKVRAGMEVADSISKIDADNDNRPFQAVTIVSIQKL